MSTKTTWALAATCLMLTLCMNRMAVAQFASLVKRIPASANTIMLFNIAKDIDAATAYMRRQMTQKYSVEF